MTERGVVALGLVLLATTPAVAGPPYRWLDGRGTPIWSDRPPAAGIVLPAPPDARGAPAAALQPRGVGVDDVLEAPAVTGPVAAVVAQLAAELRLPLTSLAGEPGVASRTVTAALDARRLRRAVRATLQHGDSAHLRAVEAWYQAPAGARVAAHARSLATPAGREDLAAFVARAVAAPLPPTRRVLMERLDWVEGDTDLATDVVLTALRAAARAMNAALPPERRRRAAALDHEIEQLRPRIHGDVQRATLAALHFIHRDANDEELRTRVTFAASEASRWYVAAVRRALVRVAAETVERPGSARGRTISSERRPDAVASAPGR